MSKIFNDLEERLNYIEFRQKLLFYNTAVDRVLFEYEIDEEQYKQIVNLMDNYRHKLNNSEVISSCSFEDDMYKILPEHRGRYSMCEALVRAFNEDNRWEDVFSALYGNN